MKTVDKCVQSFASFREHMNHLLRLVFVTGKEAPAATVAGSPKSVYSILEMYATTAPRGFDKRKYKIRVVDGVLHGGFYVQIGLKWNPINIDLHGSRVRTLEEVATTLERLAKDKHGIDLRAVKLAKATWVRNVSYAVPEATPTTPISILQWFMETHASPAGATLRCRDCRDGRRVLVDAAAVSANTFRTGCAKFDVSWNVFSSPDTPLHFEVTEPLVVLYDHDAIRAYIDAHNEFMAAVGDELMAAAFAPSRFIDSVLSDEEKAALTDRWR